MEKRYYKQYLLIRLRIINSINSCFWLAVAALTHKWWLLAVIPVFWIFVSTRYFEFSIRLGDRFGEKSALVTTLAMLPLVTFGFFFCPARHRRSSRSLGLERWQHSIDCFWTPHSGATVSLLSRQSPIVRAKYVTDGGLHQGRLPFHPAWH